MIDREIRKIIFLIFLFCVWTFLWLGLSFWLDFKKKINTVKHYNNKIEETIKFNSN